MIANEHFSRKTMKWAWALLLVWSVPACTKARAAVKGSSDAADKAFKSCFAAGAPKAAHFADAVSAAKKLYDAMK